MYGIEKASYPFAHGPHTCGYGINARLKKINTMQVYTTNFNSGLTHMSSVIFNYLVHKNALPNELKCAL